MVGLDIPELDTLPASKYYALMKYRESCIAVFLPVLRAVGLPDVGPHVATSGSTTVNQRNCMGCFFAKHPDFGSYSAWFSIHMGQIKNAFTAKKIGRAHV